MEKIKNLSTVKKVLSASFLVLLFSSRVAFSETLNPINCGVVVDSFPESDCQFHPILVDDNCLVTYGMLCSHDMIQIGKSIAPNGDIAEATLLPSINDKGEVVQTYLIEEKNKNGVLKEKNTGVYSSDFNLTITEKLGIE